MRPPTLAHSARRPPPLCASRAITPDRYTERSAEIWLDWLKSGKAIGRPHLHRDPPTSQSQLLGRRRRVQVPNYYKNKSTYSSTEHTTVG